MKRWKKVATQIVCVAQVAACASQPDSIEARYVSPITYKNWTCEQLVDERKRLESEVRRITGLQKENADADAALMGVGLILFWPALFGLAATKDRKEDLGKLKGEYDAVGEQMKMKGCAPPPPSAPAAIEAEAAPADVAPKGAAPSDTPSAEAKPQAEG